MSTDSCWADELYPKKVNEICQWCLAEIDWDGADEQGRAIWGCEKCGRCFCENCFQDKHGIKVLHDMVIAESQKEILCPDCYGSN